MISPPRVLVVTTWFPDADHPARTPFCLAHVEAIQSVGVPVEVVHVDLAGGGKTPVSETYEGVRVRRLGLDVRNPLSWLRVHRELARSLRSADILHTMAFSSILVALSAGVRRRRPWVHTEHWNGVTNPRSVGGWWLRVSWLRHTLRLPDAVTGVTSQLAAEMSRFARNDAMHVVPCVVRAPAVISPFPPPDPLRLVGVGLLIERKNPLLALETIAELTRSDVDVRYVWVGDGPLRETAEARSRQLGLAGIVTFVGSVPPEQVHKHLADAHLFFVPSGQENFFTAVAESISAGRPAVVPLSGGFGDYCTTDNSEVLETWDPVGLAEGISAARNRFSGCSPDAISGTLADRFSPLRIGDQFANIYRLALDHDA